ncbi:unnamed protein product [Fusarium graminearum]|uniref:Uncharacterized protein n=1 Tax=Gibberella zeae TaxID=5518 RepID=A0A4E9DIL5_GIBZA|nr:unnamed protein product [Fusarium graminearum]CAF3551879.1 unnamed protein product [Fusarium graminearum]CAG2008067.1 unnamed protein product [Fusarium graminearum]CAG2013125.1 unnamed protein product [Fusarium graminearum]
MANQPAGGGTEYDDFIDNSDITTARPPSSTITNFMQLTTFERLRLAEHLRAWVKVVDKEDAKAHQLTITKNHRKRFNEELKEDSRLCVSVWSQDLPLSVAAKRKRDDDDDDKTPSPKKTKRDGRTSPRKSVQPAFVTINKTIGRGEPKVSFDFKDNLATSEFIQWDDPLGAESMKAKAMAQNDMHECESIRNFNKERIIKSARNHIVELSNAGTHNDDLVSMERPFVPELSRPTLALDILKQIHAENARIIAFAESLSHSEAN